MAAKHNPRDCVARYGDCGGCDDECPVRGQRALGTGANPPPPVPAGLARPRTITIPSKEVEALVANIVEREQAAPHVPTHEPDSAPTIVIDPAPAHLTPLQSEAERDLARAWASNAAPAYSEGERQVRNVFGGNVDLGPGTTGAAIVETLGKVDTDRTRSEVQVFGNNHMPAELAARMLEAHNARKYDDVSAEQRESLVLFAEECAEATQRATKIHRFGKGAKPGDTLTNVRLLSEEVGHVQASIDLLVQHDLVDTRYMMLARARKLEDYARENGVTRHQSTSVRQSVTLLARAVFERIMARTRPSNRPTPQK